MMKFKVIFKFRDAVFARDGDEWLYIDGYEQIGPNQSEYDYKRIFKSMNPLLVWRTFISQIQLQMDMRIGAMLEEQNRNKFTSIPLGKELTPEEKERYTSGKWIEKGADNYAE